MGEENETVIGVVHDLREQGYGHVWGFTDRDFSHTNRANWLNPQAGIEVYKPTAFELENYLLDWLVLAGCGENMKRLHRTADDIKDRAENYAQSMVWWMACCKVLADYWERLVGMFPGYPKISQIRNLDEARDHILNDRNWFISFPTQAAHIQDTDKVNGDLTNVYDVYRNDLQSGVWVQSFSGKEIFRRVRGYLFNRRYASDEEMDVDLAKSIADWQVLNNAIPQELLELKSVIRQRVGI